MSRIPSKEELQSALKQYEMLLDERAESGQAKGAKDLRELDQKLWKEWSPALRENSKTSMTLVQLKEVMRYKLARGKFRPTLPSLIASNTDTLVEETTRTAFKESTETSMKTLCRLKGVGPATASLLLSLHNPKEEAFMSDESWECLEDLKGKKIGYTEKDWKVWRETLRKRVELDGWGSASEFERACWAFVRLRARDGEGKPSEKGATTAAVKRKGGTDDAEPTASKAKRSKQPIEKATVTPSSNNARTTRSRSAKE